MAFGSFSSHTRNSVPELRVWHAPTVRRFLDGLVEEMDPL